MLTTLLLALLAVSSHGQSIEEDLVYGKFPLGFKWGAATAAYQVEGGWNDDGKGANIWDTFSHEQGNVVDGSSGDIACNSYQQYREDVQMLSDLGVSFYRFSISWSRVLPNG